MYTNPTSAQSVRYVRDALKKTIAPELQSDQAKVLIAMIDTTLASVEKRVEVEQQYMAEECGRMRDLLEAASGRLAGNGSASAEELRANLAALPPVRFAPIPAFTEVNAAYAETSRLFTASLGSLHALAAEGEEAAPALIGDARAYIALRLQRDMSYVYAMEGGLIGKG